MIRPLARDVLLVAAGGAVGSVLRWGVTHVVATGSGWPWATLGCNVLGAFLLGLLLEALTRPGDETPRAHSTRLVLGTGLLGGFTTYSAFAQDLWEQLAAGGTGQAVLTAAVMLLAGLLAAGAGVLCGARVRAGAPGAEPRNGGQR
ncbi:fluoride exporter [Kocuria rhizophila]|uniref:CrcB family protein n=1 Tax=Kocuria rhizophila TaxID=72000 RepID=UPI00190C61BB|nr:CrcB family protein [Kocuria rhizophila]MBK4121378.1 CrcB family protein [Kocuria rhizophila]MCC5672254.1 CrcB family protein [Kocuria rhizophila]MDV5998752.1 CrcB family protein [Kocuria rhizophila]